MKRKLLAITLMLACVTLASAQNKWKFNLGFGGELKTGNVNSITLSNTGGIERNDSLISFSADYGIVYGEKDKVKYDEGLTANVKFDLWQYDRWSPFLAWSYVNNKFKGYNFKNSFLAGVKYRIYAYKDRCDYSVSAAYVYDFVEYTLDDDALKPQVSRLSLRIKGKQQIGDIITIKHTTFYQPSLMSMDDFKKDYIITSVTTFSNQIAKNISLDLNFAYEYRGIVPEDIKHEDITATASLKFSF